MDVQFIFPEANAPLANLSGEHRAGRSGSIRAAALLDFIARLAALVPKPRV